jgi:hypothetical protein
MSGENSVKNSVDEIKKLLKEKLEITEIPDNGVECITVREQIIPGKSYVAEVAIGKVWKYRTYFNVVGMVFNEDKFRDASMKIETRNRQKSIEILCAVSQTDFATNVDEFLDITTKINTLSDLITFLKEL